MQGGIVRKPEIVTKPMKCAIHKNHSVSVDYKSFGSTIMLPTLK